MAHGYTEGVDGEGLAPLYEEAPCKDWFPEGLVFELSKDHGAKLTDFVPNTDGFIIIVSEKLKDILESQAPDDPIEFLPIRLHNPKKKKLFRPGEKRNLIIAHEQLAQGLLDADYTGMMFIPVEDYGGEFRSDEEDEDD